MTYWGTIVDLNILSFKEVTFEKNVGIKDVKINELILRPYEINGHIVVNVDGYAKDGLIVKQEKKQKNKEHYIKNIIFEDPHITNNAKIYFIGTEFENGDFTNRNLSNVIFQNCNFEKTYFLNSFLDKTIFLNCEFPTIRNDADTSLLPRKSPLIAYWFFALIISVTVAFYVNKYFFVLTIILMLPTILNKVIDKILSYTTTKKYLINHHIGIADERKLVDDYLKNKSKKGTRDEKLDNYDITLQNINAIYNDLKVNFKNVSNFQQSGDFYYAQNVTKINLSERPFEVFLLMFSFIFNGFGERYIRSLGMIIVLLLTIAIINKPNIDYISTPSTPPFLLDVTNNQKPQYKAIDYNISNFLHISSVVDYLDKNQSNVQFSGYDNRFNFKYNDQRIPKLANNTLVKFYYASSHITAPFTQENKKWFQNMSKKSYAISIPITIFLWLSFIGMITAIFNRIRR